MKIGRRKRKGMGKYKRAELKLDLIPKPRGLIVLYAIIYY